MGRGKIAAQVGHAAIGLARRMPVEKLAKTMSNNTSHVVLYVDTLEEMDTIASKALDSGYTICRIVDEGVTQVPPGSVTVIGINTGNGGKNLFRGLKLVS